MQLKYRIAILIMLSCISFSLWADPLPLSNHEIQKLKHYFPSQDDSTHHTWKGDPISILLPVKVEKRIVFPVHVVVDAKGSLTADQLRIINNNMSVYLTALKPFSKTRLYVTLQDTNEVVLLDLATSDNASKDTAYIDVQKSNDQPVVESIASAASTYDQADSNIKPVGNHYVMLIRFAWQQLFAPERLVDNPLGISRTAMHTQSFLTNLVYGDKVYAHPEISWVYNGTYVTAVELRNKYSHATTINLKNDLCGDWQAASIYPRNHLKPASDKRGDTATLIIVSNKPFGESMEVCNGHA